MHEILKNKAVIFFDMGYTIDYPASGDWMFINRFHEIAGDRLKKCSGEQIRSAKSLGLDYLSKTHLIRDEEEEVANLAHYYRIVSDELGLDLSEADVMEISRDRTCNMDNYPIFPDARAVLQELSRTHRLGIISDTWPSIERQLQTLNIKQYFSFTTFSYSLGVFKPDRRMYLDALGKCGHDAKDTVFIDDNPANLEGAAKLGITPILIAANPESDVETEFVKIYTLSELL